MSSREPSHRDLTRRAEQARVTVKPSAVPRPRPGQRLGLHLPPGLPLAPAPALLPPALLLYREGRMCFIYFLKDTFSAPAFKIKRV